MKNVEAQDYYFFTLEYFKNFQQLLGENQKLILAKLDGEIIGGMLLMTSEVYSHYHLSCRKKEFGKLALNNLLLDYAIKYSKKLGCRYFHLGGGSSLIGDDNLFKFKANFSKTTELFYIGAKIHNQDIYDDIVRQWVNNNPEKAITCKNILLKYRM